MADESDRELIKQALQGDRAAFEKLVCRYDERLYNTVFRYLGNAQDAEDVVQETFINAYQSLHTFRGDSQFFTWLYRIAYSTAVKHKREGKGDSSVEPHAVLPTNPVLREEEERRIREGLERLSPEHRIVLVLKELEGRKYEEIAKILQVPIGTVRSRVHEARLQLRKLLEQGPDRRTDAQLVAESVHGDEFAFARLLFRYEKQFARMTRELVPDPKDRERVRNQIFSAAQKELSTFNGDRPFLTWLYLLARRIVDNGV